MVMILSSEVWPSRKLRTRQKRKIENPAEPAPKKQAKSNSKQELMSKSKKKRKRRQEKEEAAQWQRELCSMMTSKGTDDEELRQGTKVRVYDSSGWGEDGVYMRFERNTFGANSHYIRFDSGVKMIKLTGKEAVRFEVLEVPFL